MQLVSEGRAARPSFKLSFLSTLITKEYRSVLSPPVVVIMTGNSIRFRPGSIDDLESIVELWIESARFHARLEPRFQYAPDVTQPTKEYYAKQLQSENSYVGVAQSSDDIVGFISAQVHERPPIHVPRRMGFIDGLFVKSSVRRLGIGTRLWHMALDWLKLQEVHKAHVTVASMNPESIEFWRKKGFSDLMLRLEFDCT